jgi:hypothetical protein
VRRLGGQLPQSINFVSISGAYPFLNSRITFTRASTGTYVNSSGALSSAAINAPRFDYDPMTLAPKGLLIEEQRTNLIRYSQDISTSTWTAGAFVTTNVNSGVSPDGMQNATAAMETTNNGAHTVAQAVTVAANTSHAASIYLKANGRDQAIVYFGMNGAPYTRIGVLVNLSTGLLVNSDIGTPSSVTVRSLTPVGNGWYRLVIAGIAATATTSNIFEVRFYNGTTTSYVGDPTKGMFVWGGQVEAGAFATSLIPTTTTALTRAADVARVTGANFSSWFNVEQGTMFVEAQQQVIFAASKTAVSFTNGTSAQRLTLYRQAVGSINAFSDPGNVVLNSGLAATAGVTWKSALAYSASPASFSANGITPLSLFYTVDPNVFTELAIGNAFTGGNQYFNGHISSLTYYTTRLSNAELQALTS